MSFINFHQILYESLPLDLVDPLVDDWNKKISSVIVTCLALSTQPFISLTHYNNKTFVKNVQHWPTLSNDRSSTTTIALSSCSPHDQSNACVNVAKYYWCAIVVIIIVGRCGGFDDDNDKSY